MFGQVRDLISQRRSTYLDELAIRYAAEVIEVVVIWQGGPHIQHTTAPCPGPSRGSTSSSHRLSTNLFMAMMSQFTILHKGRNLPHLFFEIDLFQLKQLEAISVLEGGTVRLNRFTLMP